jgi:hypothetical protein
VASRIEQSYLRRFETLAEATRLLILTAAAEPLGDPVLLDRATRDLGIDLSSAVTAVDAGMLRLRERVEFAHPLVRSATYYGASERDRRRFSDRHRGANEVADAVAEEFVGEAGDQAGVGHRASPQATARPPL